VWWNHRRRVRDKCQKPYRELAHASLRLGRDPIIALDQYGGGKSQGSRKELGLLTELLTNSAEPNETGRDE
jgi:hypothetical protein